MVLTNILVGFDPTSAACVTTMDVDLQSELNALGNRSDLISVGPFDDFQPGDAIKVSFAYVVAKKFEDGLPNGVNNATQQTYLLDAANWAQRTYNGEDTNFNGILDEGEDKDGNGVITRFILPSPPETPIIRVEPGDGECTIYWADNSRQSEDPISKKRTLKDITFTRLKRDLMFLEHPIYRMI